MLEPQVARSRELARIHRAIDDPWIAAVHAAEARGAPEDEHAASMFALSAQALTAAGRLVTALIHWAWAPDYQRPEIEPDIAAWATEIRAADGSWTGRYTDAAPRYRWRVPFGDTGLRALEAWLSAVVDAEDLPAGPEPPVHEDHHDHDELPASTAAPSEHEDVSVGRNSILAILDERLSRQAVWADPIPLARATRSREAVLAATTSVEVEAAWQLGEGLLLIDDAWNAAFCAALLAPIEALVWGDDTIVELARRIRDELLGPGAASTAFAAELVHDRLTPNVEDPNRAAGARTGEAGFEALQALRLTETRPDVALLRPSDGESGVRRWDLDCPIDSSVWATIAEPG